MLFRKERVKSTEIIRNLLRNGNDGMNKIQERCRIKKERIRSLKYLVLLGSPMRKRTLSGKVSFCTSLKRIRKASLAVETALVLPVFFLGLVTLVSFMDIYKIQTEHLVSLCQKAKEAGMYAYGTEGNGTPEITLPDVYTYQPVGGLFSLPKVWMYNTVKVHTWTGTQYEETLSDSQQTEEHMVFVTENGSVCHSSATCSYLNLSVSQIKGSAVETSRNEYGERYSACELCCKNQAPSSSVYVTQSGNRYHNLGSCSGLKRSVRLVKESDVAGMRHCSRCG